MKNLKNLKLGCETKKFRTFLSIRRIQSAEQSENEKQNEDKQNENESENED